MYIQREREIYIYIYVYIHTSIYLIYNCICMYMHIYIYTCIWYVYIYIYTFIYIPPKQKHVASKPHIFLSLLGCAPKNMVPDLESEAILSEAKAHHFWCSAVASRVSNMPKRCKQSEINQKGWICTCSPACYCMIFLHVRP